MSKSVGFRIASGTFFNVGGELLANIISFTGSIVIARILLPQEYGLIFAVISLPQLLNGLASLGFDRAIIRFTSRKEWVVVWPLVFLKISIGVVFAISLLLFPEQISTILNKPVLSQYLFLGALYLVFLIVSNTMISILNGLGFFEYIALAKVVRSIVRVTISITLLIIGFRIVGVLAGHVIGYSTQFLLLLIYGLPLFYKEYVAAGEPGVFNLNGLYRGLAFTAPLIATTAIDMIVTPYLNVLSIRYSNSYVLGNFNITGIFLTAISIVTSMMAQAFISGFSYVRDRDLLNVIFKKSTMYSSLMVSVIAIPLIVLSKPIVWSIYGLKYAYAPDMVSIASLVSLSVIFGGYTIVPYYIAIGETKKLGLISASISTLSLITGTYLVINYGVWGILYNWIIASYSYTAVAVTYAIRKYGLVIGLRDNVRVFMPALLSGIFVAPFIHLLPYKFYGLIWFVPYMIIYMTLVALFVEREELEEIRRLAYKLKYFGKILAEIISWEIKVKDAITSKL